jgi:hypothetical protein
LTGRKEGDEDTNIAAPFEMKINYIRRLVSCQLLS